MGSGDHGWAPPSVPQRDRSRQRRLDRSGRFGSATFHHYEWDASYSTEDYRKLLLTYSGHIAMDPSDQNGLLDCIADLIDLRYEGEITKRYLAELRIAHRQ